MIKLAYETLEGLSGLLFVTAGTSKILDGRSFLLTLYSIPLFPAQLARATYKLFPILEVGIGILAIFGSKIAVLAMAAFLIAFSLVAILSIKVGLTIKCNCFGAQSGNISWGLIARNTAWCGLLLNVYFSTYNIKPNFISTYIALTVVTTVGLLFCLIQNQKQLLYLKDISVL